MKRRSKFKGPLEKVIEQLDVRLFYLIDEFGDELKEFLDERGSEIDEVGKALLLRSLRMRTLGLMELADQVDPDPRRPAKAIQQFNDDIPC
jgi:hypothetical protein